MTEILHTTGFKTTCAAVSDTLNTEFSGFETVCNKAGYLLLYVCLFVGFVGTDARAMFALPQPVPVDRLIKNTRQYVKEHPKDAQGYYTLARVYYMAFANGAAEVAAFLPRDKGKLPDIRENNSWLYQKRSDRARKILFERYGYKTTGDIPKQKKEDFHKQYRALIEQLKMQGWAPEDLRLSQERLTEFADGAYENFTKAVKLRPRNGLYHLGLACFFEQYADRLKSGPAKQPKFFYDMLLSRAQGSFHTAYSLSISKDLRHREIPLSGLSSLVGYEAGKGWLRVVQKREKKLTLWEKARVRAVKKSIAKLDALPIGAITPIIFSLSEDSKRSCQGLSGLLDGKTTVSFDLDGTGRPQYWPWVRPDTAILVWDPDGTGKITSGRQLFGSVTWWLFFETGYQALDCLDDDRDGQLTGTELAGVSVWLDTNSNGIADKGEVAPVGKYSIVSIAVRPTQQAGQGLINNFSLNIRTIAMNPAGIKLADGRKIATYDWIAEPVEKE